MEEASIEDITGNITGYLELATNSIHYQSKKYNPKLELALRSESKQGRELTSFYSNTWTIEEASVVLMMATHLGILKGSENLD